MEEASADFTIPPTSPDDMALDSFHQRNDRPTERRRSRPRGDRHALRDRALCARSACRRHLLVHRGPRLGDGDELRNHRAAGPWRDQHRRRGGVRCANLVRHSRARARQRVVHGAHRHPHDDEARRGGAGGFRSFGACVSRPASANRSIPRRSSGAPRRSDGRSTTIGGRPRRAESWSPITPPWTSSRARWGVRCRGSTRRSCEREADGRIRVIEQPRRTGRAGAAGRAGRR